MLEAQTDAAILKFVAQNYKRLKRECAIAQQQTQIHCRKSNNAKIQRTKTAARQNQTHFNREKYAKSFVGRCAAQLGCGHTKIVRAKKLIETLQQKKITREVVIKIMRGQASFRDVIYGAGCVYLLAAGNVIKIGCTKLAAAERVARIKPDTAASGGDATLRLIGYVKTNDPHALELMLHQQYKNQRVRGEWFNLTDDDIAAILTIKQ